MIPNLFILDQFIRPDGVSALETSWTCFTDRVIGGKSNAVLLREQEDDRFCLRLKGHVSMHNHGGFIQAALPLATNGYPFVASHFQGIACWVKGLGEGYCLHLRTAELNSPWQHYRAPLPVTPEWHGVIIPFSHFVPVNTYLPLNLNLLTRLGVVAYGHEFDADIMITELALYAA